jgi:hypothetical protein
MGETLLQQTSHVEELKKIKKVLACDERSRIVSTNDTHRQKKGAGRRSKKMKQTE